nr:hypothetical protein [Tanacetum cinerariifolium]
MCNYTHTTPTSNPKEAVCFYCNIKGHWKHRCLKYSKDLKDERSKRVVTQGLKESRRLKHGELNLVMENRKITHVIRIRKNLNKKRIVQLQKDRVLESFNFKLDDVCKFCLLGKITKSPFTLSFERGEGLLELVHTDVCGPIRYCVTFTDDFSRYGYVYLIKHKSDTFLVFKMYQNEVKNQLGGKIKLTPPRTPQLNEVAERRNRTLLDLVRSMMSRATLPISFWGYTLETTAHILNLLPTKKVSKTPFEMWKGKQPIVNTNTQQEVVTPVKSKSDDTSLSIRRTSGRVSKPLQFYYGFNIEEDKISDSTLSELDELANYKEAMASPKAAKWKEDMKTEIRSMYDNQVWNLVDTTPVLKMMGCKWIFNKFTDVDGKVHTYKARSVVVFLVLYVDDILLIGKDIPTLQSVKDWLGKCFAMKDLGDAAYILVADSTRESEYCEASKEAIWMKNFIGDLRVVPTVQDPIEIFYDNESAVALTKEPNDHEKSKHIERKYHFVLSIVNQGHVIMKHIRSEDNPSDPFTKALAKSQHDEHARSIRLKYNIKF